MTHTRMQPRISSVFLSLNIGPIFEGRKQKNIFRTDATIFLCDMIKLIVTNILTRCSLFGSYKSRSFLQMVEHYARTEDVIIYTNQMG